MFATPSWLSSRDATIALGDFIALGFDRVARFWLLLLPVLLALAFVAVVTSASCKKRPRKEKPGFGRSRSGFCFEVRSVPATPRRPERLEVAGALVGLGGPPDGTRARPPPTHHLARIG
jgi:hypothetical protein